MKQILLSADGEWSVYLVPDAVVANLPKYLGDFRDWMVNGPEASKYRWNGCLCFTEVDFIEYLNQQVFPSEPSVFVKNVGYINSEEEIPEEYKGCLCYNF